MRKTIKLLLAPLLLIISSCNNTHEILCYGPPLDNEYSGGEYTLPPNFEKEEGTLYLDDVSSLLNVSDDEFFTMYKDLHFFPEKYNVISEQKIQDFTLSSSSKEEALEKALSLKTDNNRRDLYCIGTSSKFVLETDLFYVVDVTWNFYRNGEKDASYEDNVISFKKEYVECNRFDTCPLKIIDFSKTQEIIDSFIIGRNQFTYNYVFVCSNLLEENETYSYTSYTMSVSHGDWGMDNSLYLEEQKCVIDEATGIVEFGDYKKLREINFR